MRSLSDFFADQKLATEALDKYLVFALKQDPPWNVVGPEGKLDLYELSYKAFGPNIRRESEFAFCDLYWTIRGWMGSKSLARPSVVYGLLCSNCRDYFWGRHTTLANLKRVSVAAAEIGRFLPAFEVFRLNEEYPWMVVSKVLHFANPSLFPMWDKGVIWRRIVWGHGEEPTAPFSANYNSFCSVHGFNPKEYGCIFMLNYTLWAAETIQQRHPDFMSWFADWMSTNFDADIRSYQLQDLIPQLYATAFEFVMIGAAQH